MRKNLLLALVLAFIAAVAFAHYPDVIKINAAAKKQPAVSFPHAKHGDTWVKDCTTCHHMEKGLTKEVNAKNQVNVRKCSTCHLKPQGKMGTMADMSPVKNPMHVRCIGCHKQQKKGPTTCTGCHKK